MFHLSGRALSKCRTGNISVAGGAGGSQTDSNLAGDGGGGGGGGGQINVYNTDSSIPYDFVGVLYVLGGSGGAGIDGTVAGSGTAGIIAWPNCSAGQGNSLVPPYTICETCPTGTYTATEGPGACQPCDPIPDFASFTPCSDTGCTDPNCPFTCDPGYATESCVNPFTALVNYVGGLAVFCSLASLLFLMLLVPFIRYRYNALYGWRAKEDDWQDFNASTNFLTTFRDDDNPSQPQSSGKGNPHSGSRRYAKTRKVEAGQMKYGKHSESGLNEFSLSMASVSSVRGTDCENPMHDGVEVGFGRNMENRGKILLVCIVVLLCVVCIYMYLLVNYCRICSV